ncbi:hypothetical protein A2673_03310 [Candidatus Kaiserbacteria bacterium RIFCSPHIGHO2_01_FULL_50_13]|uniref:Peptidyl-tRNA hydrolase n=1 Tax=Candidatus Kaiserbacteria bacterium RIFCSPLOWO2_01_FULL_50_24 TaxID=1798507 RepID=A0A1F6EIQ6_9BACT|nr:MAG: hypothetical protein A2673_03310 [Candidatus Kaiserbacteria bacterium RIFCSPHIGHO2_01_FULL_50_13]OGG73533.1 MAG: hypothetical protein A3A34_01150 [Candidatus Kaiserbacteria bacterium RIFCSPLOWO2_01_FULL_50_24]OGG81581.1 MAG: hypothetical protein A3H74_00685 [Candidatus Kaiserbacteria bacterium RIFCSPLOWO2_02_FULL_51_13]
MWVIVGLGNPDAKYEGTRHNTGRDAVRFFGSKTGFTDWRKNTKAVALVAGDKKVTLLLPDTYMNKSGNAVAKFVKSVKAAERLVVVHDDLDLPLGTIKISFGRGSGGHKGAESIMRAVKTKKFVRVRVGVSPANASGKIKKPQGEERVDTFILSKFKPTEQEQLKKVFTRTADALDTLVKDGREKAMNVFN